MRCSDLLDDIECTRYQTEKAYLSFDEYVQMTKERNRDVTEIFREHGIAISGVCYQFTLSMAEEINPLPLYVGARFCGCHSRRIMSP